MGATTFLPTAEVNATVDVSSIRWMVKFMKWVIVLQCLCNPYLKLLL